MSDETPHSLNNTEVEPPKGAMGCLTTTLFLLGALCALLGGGIYVVLYLLYEFNITDVKTQFGRSAGMSDVNPELMGLATILLLATPVLMALPLWWAGRTKKASTKE